MNKSCNNSHVHSHIMYSILPVMQLPYLPFYSSMNDVWMTHEWRMHCALSTQRGLFFTQTRHPVHHSCATSSNGKDKPHPTPNLPRMQNSCRHKASVRSEAETKQTNKQNCSDPSQNLPEYCLFTEIYCPQSLARSSVNTELYMWHSVASHLFDTFCGLGRCLYY